MEPVKQENVKVDIGDVIFYILTIIILIFLIPFYSGIIEILKYASQLMVGVNIYIALGGVALGFSIIVVGFKKKMSPIKIIGLLFMTGCLLYPFYDYIGNRGYFKEVLGNYTFDELVVIAHTDCEMEKQMQAEVANKFSVEFGEDVEVNADNIETTDPTDGTIKDKLRCMPSTTHIVYKISYKDKKENERVIVYDGKNNFSDMILLESYKILQEDLEEYLNSKKNGGKISYQLKLYSNGRGIIDVDNNTLLSEKVKLPYPSNISIDNFYQDDRLILDISFELNVNKDLAHEIVEDLIEIENKDIPVIIHYGQSTEYYFKGNWYKETEKELYKKISGNV